MSNVLAAVQALALQVHDGTVATKNELDAAKRRCCAERGITMIPNREIVGYFRQQNWPIPPILLRKPTRTLSGVAIVAVMTPPRGCIGTCTFCPSSQIGVPTPKSYTGAEPSTRRSIRFGYNPFQVIKHRLDQLESLGHSTSKVELILQGGTLPAEPLEHQQFVVKRCLEAFAGRVCDSLEEAKAACEKSDHRLVGFTVETRPDWCSDDDIRRFLDWGVTRVELGVQLPDDAVYEKTRRGHLVADVVNATARLREAGLKVGYHLMPGQPGSNVENDLEKMKMIFTDERFLPDFVKFYPCLVVPGTKLFRDWQAGLFRPYSTQQAAEIIGEISRFIPEYTRVMRIQRDIPANLIADGVNKGNLRELVDDYMEKRQIQCRCIRCREAGLRNRSKPKQVASLPELRRLDYRAGGGDEVFLSMVEPTNDTLFAMLRLRRLGPKALLPLESGHAIVREVRVFDRAIELGTTNDASSAQHQGLGSRLLAEAEKIAFDEWKSPVLAVISGLGVREYYFNHGFVPWGPYVAKIRQGFAP